jgi:hypothetical protein
MTTALGPPSHDDLEGRASEAERRLLVTLDILAERRRRLRASLRQARTKLESGAAILSMFLLVGVAMLGVLSLKRRSRWRRS